MTIIRQYIVTVEAETKEQADQVMAERLNPDEDYGFPYEVGHSGACAEALSLFVAGDKPEDALTGLLFSDDGDADDYALNEGLAYVYAVKAVVDYSNPEITWVVER
jgi:hypothetical protein